MEARLNSAIIKAILINVEAKGRARGRQNSKMYRNKILNVCIHVLKLCCNYYRIVSTLLHTQIVALCDSIDIIIRQL